MSKPKQNDGSPRPARSRKTRQASPKPGKPGRRTTNGKPVPPVRSRTKQAALIDLLKRKNGATVVDLGKMMGWQPHSVRAAISGLRKRGLTVTRTRNEAGVTVYRIAGGS